jgi:multisubunit Na+/H+ antiporter MnhC subunit
VPITDVIIITAIVLAFVVFGATLAWAERQTRHLPALTPQNSGEKPKAANAPSAIQANVVYH